MLLEAVVLNLTHVKGIGPITSYSAEYSIELLQMSSRAEVKTTTFYSEIILCF